MRLQMQQHKQDKTCEESDVSLRKVKKAKRRLKVRLSSAMSATRPRMPTVDYDQDHERHRRRQLVPSSRHYQSYCDEHDVICDALRWYRHSVECFKARDDDIGVARSASAFARLQLELIIGPVAFERVPLPTATAAFLFGSQSCPRSLQMPTVDDVASEAKAKSRVNDIDSAARCALSIAAVVCEPLLLLESYLNVAEVRLVRRDRLGAIAHWWEARELFLRLFVVGTRVPLVYYCAGDFATTEALRVLLERLVRFLGACDRAMINENLLLFDIFVTFERDARASRLSASKHHFLFHRKHSMLSQMEFTRTMSNSPGPRSGGSSVTAVNRSGATADHQPDVMGSMWSTSKNGGLASMSGNGLRHYDLKNALADVTFFHMNATSAQARTAPQQHLSLSAVDYAHHAMQPFFYAAAINSRRFPPDAEDKVFRLRLGLVPSTERAKRDCSCDAWECIARIRNNVSRHCREKMAAHIEDLRDRNRSILRVLCSRMRSARAKLSAAPPSSYTFDALRHQAGETGTARERLDNIVYAVHVASMLLVYCPRTGARHTFALGRGGSRFGGLASEHEGPTIVSSTPYCQKRCRLRTDDKDTSATTWAKSDGYGDGSSISSCLTLKSAILIATFAGERWCQPTSQAHRSAMVEQSSLVEIMARRSALTTVAKDLGLPRNLFEDLLGRYVVRSQTQLKATSPSSRAGGTVTTSLKASRFEDRTSGAGTARGGDVLSVRLVCSERAQLIPWECLAGDSIRCSRVPCAYLVAIAASDIPSFPANSVPCPSRSLNTENSGSNYHVSVFKRDSFEALQEPADVVLELLSGLCQPDIIRSAALHLGRVAHSQWPLHRPVSSTFMLSPWGSSIHDGNVTPCSWTVSAWLSCGRKRRCKPAEHGSSSDVDAIVVVHDFASLLVASDISELVDNTGNRAVFFAPSSCVEAVRASAKDRFRDLPSVLTLRCAACGESRLDIDEKLLADFAHSMTRKFAAPVVYYAHLRTPFPASSHQTPTEHVSLSPDT